MWIRSRFPPSWRPSPSFRLARSRREMLQASSCMRRIAFCLRQPDRSSSRGDLRKPQSESRLSQNSGRLRPMSVWCSLGMLRLAHAVQERRVAFLGMSHGKRPSRPLGVCLQPPKRGLLHMGEGRGVLILALQLPGACGLFQAEGRRATAGCRIRPLFRKEGVRRGNQVACSERCCRRGERRVVCLRDEDVSRRDRRRDAPGGAPVDVISSRTSRRSRWPNRHAGSMKRMS